MPKIDDINVLFDEIDANRDGKIDKYEFQQWVASNEGVPSSRYRTRTSDIYLNDNSTRRFDRNRHEISTSDIYFNDNSTRRYGRSRYATYGSAAVASGLTHESVIETSSLEETNEWLERAVDVYKDSDPLIIRKATMEHPVTYQQRILVRYLQPPDVPPPGPLIIKEVRAPQPPPPAALCIRQYGQAPPSPAPLILRERPPTPPPLIRSETVTRQVAALPTPPRSVVIERFPSLPERPRDIIIERWRPYGPPPERRTIVERAAAAAITYAEPRNKIIIYEGVEARVVRQFERDGVIRENPADYVARYGNTLLDSATLIEIARNAGVHEDLSFSASSYSNVRESTTDYELLSGGRYLHDNQYISSNSSRRQGSFDFFQYGLLPADYTPGMKLHQKFVRPANFSFPASSIWSIRTAKYETHVTDDRITSVTVELFEDGLSVHLRKITEQEYENANVYSSVPKLAWDEFLRVLQVFMLGNNQERESDIKRAFDILDQGRRGLYDRTVSLSDGLISPDELRAFLSTLTDEYRVDLCVFLADTDGSGQISLSEFTRMVKSGLARDIICECT